MELADAVGGDREGDQDPLAEAAMSLQSPSGSPRRDGFSRGAGHVSIYLPADQMSGRALSSQACLLGLACCMVSMLPGLSWCKGTGRCGSYAVMQEDEPAAAL